MFAARNQRKHNSFVSHSPIRPIGRRSAIFRARSDTYTALPEQDPDHAQDHVQVRKSQPPYPTYPPLPLQTLRTLTSKSYHLTLCNRSTMPESAPYSTATATRMSYRTGPGPCESPCKPMARAVQERGA